MIIVRALGPVEVSVNGGKAPAALLWSKHLALLVYLARSPKRARTREHLVGMFWGDKSEDKARRSLNEALRELRRYTGHTTDVKAAQWLEPELGHGLSNVLVPHSFPNEDRLRGYQDGSIFFDGNSL